MKKILLITTALIAAAEPAHAGPVAAAVAWVGSTLASSTIAGFALRMVAGFALNAISSALMKPDAPKANVKFDVEIGDDLPLRMIVGDYVTAGQRKYIGSWGKNTRFITEVIEVSSVPQGYGDAWVNDEKATYNGNRAYISQSATPSGVRGWDEAATVPSGAMDMGIVLTNLSDDGNRIAIKWVDGSQTAADPFLVRVFGGDADYPWTTSHIGRGKSYAIVTTRYDDDSLTSYPRFLFQPAPLPMYDWRKDSSNGGSGSHRWGNRATYEATRNPAVIAYNIARGIYYGSEWVYGGKNLDAWRLPVAEWTAAANECDDAVTLAGGGTQPRYRCGLEISADMEPAGVLEELGKAANMRFAEVGGRLKPIVGLPGSAVMSITDGDILISEGQSFNPFYPVAETFNAISATYPEPGEKWTAKDAPEYVNTEASAEDGQYLPTSMNYAAVPYARQVQRLMRAQMRDFRRMRRHQFHLPPDAYGLEPGIDLISWTSDRNGYGNKLFMVESVSKTPGMNVAVSLREVDPSDYDWSSDFEKPVVITPPKNPRPPVQMADGFNVAPAVIEDAATKARRPDVLATYVGEEAGVTNIQIRARVLGKTEIVIDTLRRWNEAQSWRSFAVLPATTYEFQAKLFSNITPRGEWSAWKVVTTPDVGFSWEDWDADLREQIEGDLAQIPAAQAAAADALTRANAVRADHDALVDGFVGKLTDLTAADQGIQQRMDLLELSVNNSSYIRKTDGDGPSVGLWDGIGAATDPVSSTSVPSGMTGRSIEVSAPGAFEGPHYTGASLNGTTFRLRGWVWVSSGATARAAIVGPAGGIIVQSDPITGGWQQIDRKFEVTVETTDWAPAFLVTTGGTMRFYRVRLEDYSAAADLEASIQANAQAILDEQSARVASVGTLTARANSLAGRIFPSDMRNNAEFWQQSASGDPDSLLPMSELVQYYTDPAVGQYIRIPAGHPPNIQVLSRAVSEYVNNRKIRMSVRMRTVGGTTTKLRTIFSALRSDWSLSRNLGTTTVINPTGAGVWGTVTVDFTLPAKLADEAWFRCGVYSSAAVTPDLAIDVASIRIEDITAASELTGELSGEIVSIKGLDVNALEGTAFGVLLDQLSVQADGTSATITTQGTALATLQDGASAGYLIKAQAGNQVSLIDLIAADGSGQTPTSIIKMDAREILLKGSVYADMLAVVGIPTLVHDPLYKDLGSWLATTGILGTTSAVGTGLGVAGWGGENILTIGANGLETARTISRKVAVRPGTRVKLEQVIRSVTSGRNVRSRIFFYETEAQAAAFPTFAYSSEWIGTSATKVKVEQDVPDGCAWMAVELVNQRVTAGDNGSSWFGYPELRVMDAANLIVAGGAVADWFSANEVRAMLGQFSSLAAANIRVGAGEIKSANIGEAEVDTLNIKGDAVIVPPQQSLSTTLTGTGGWRNGVNSLNLTLNQSGRVFIMWFGALTYFQRQSQALGLRLAINGTVVWSRLTGDPPGDRGIETDWISMGWGRSLSAGSHTVRIDWWGGNSNIALIQRELLILGVKR